MPRVSIITATFNRSEVLRYAIESVRRQTYSDWEHIIVGDACTDDTEAVVRSYADHRLRFVNRIENFGEQSGPNNDGLAMARGELVAYLNHDDLWFADHLESLTGHLDRSGADLVHAPLVGVDRHGVYDPSHFVPASLWLVRRTLAEELRWRPAREIHASNPSQDFLVRAWQKSYRIECVPVVSALVLSSGGRPNAYVVRDASQHAQIFAAMQEPGFRERLLTRMVLDAEREASSLRARSQGWAGLAGRAVDRVLIAVKLHPDALRNRLSGKPKGPLDRVSAQLPRPSTVTGFVETRMNLSVDAPRDVQSVTPQWDSVTTGVIDGVVLHEVKQVITRTGALVELLRSEWLGGTRRVDQVIMRSIDPGCVSAWHVHRSTTDRLFCVSGRALVVLYDARQASSTHGTVAEYRLAPERPALLIIPPGVFHGVKALSVQSATLINMVDEAYSYTAPDHWRLPPETAEIPYRIV